MFFAYIVFVLLWTDVIHYIHLLNMFEKGAAPCPEETEHTGKRENQ